MTVSKISFLLIAVGVFLFIPACAPRVTPRDGTPASPVALATTPVAAPVTSSNPVEERVTLTAGGGSPSPTTSAETSVKETATHPSITGTSILTLQALTPSPTKLPLTTPWLRTSFPTQDICPTAVAVGIPCPTFIAVFGGAPAQDWAKPFPSPTPMPEPLTLTPVATAAAIQVVGWSPENNWLAYWVSSKPSPGWSGPGADVEHYQLAPPSSPAGPPGDLAFYNAGSGEGPSPEALNEGCIMEQFSNREGAVSVAWSAQGDAIIRMSDGTYAGIPCQPGSFRRVTNIQPTEVPASYPQISLDGKYRVETEQLKSENGILTFETRLLPAAGGSPVQVKTWQIDERLGDYSDFLGGEWIDAGQFLIYETLKEGPLILDVEEGEISVLRDLLGMKEIPSIQASQGYGLVAQGLPGKGEGTSHLLVYGVGVETNFPDVQLYHSEFDLVETLPFRYLYGPVPHSSAGLAPYYSAGVESQNYGITPDGRWLLMDDRPTIDGYEAHAVYFRPLELVDGDWSLLAYDLDSALWNDNLSEMAYTSGDVLTWQEFPDLNRIGRWQTDGYSALPAAFSRDGCRLAVAGNRPEVANDGQWDYGLFVIDKCR